MYVIYGMEVLLSTKGLTSLRVRGSITRSQHSSETLITAAIRFYWLQMKLQTLITIACTRLNAAWGLVNVSTVYHCP